MSALVASLIDKVHRSGSHSVSHTFGSFSHLSYVPFFVALSQQCRAKKGSGAGNVASSFGLQCLDVRSFEIAWRRTGVVHEVLALEVSKLGGGAIVEQTAERVHALVGKEKTRASGSRLPWLVSTLCLEQNLAVAEAVVKMPGD